MAWDRTPASNGNSRRRNRGQASSQASNQQSLPASHHSPPGLGWEAPNGFGGLAQPPPYWPRPEYAPPPANKRKDGPAGGWEAPGELGFQVRGAYKKAKLAAEAASLDASQKLPVEVWHRVFTYLPPRTLGRLLLVNKRFHGSLDPASRIGTGLARPLTPRTPSALPALKPDAIWQASRRLFWPRMPAPLRGRSELEMWRLVCSGTCESCGRKARAEPPGSFKRRTGPGPKGVIPVFPFFITACGSCLLRNGIKEIDVVLSASLPYFLLTSIPSIFLSPEMDLVPPAIMRGGVPPEMTLFRVFWPRLLDQTKDDMEEALQLGPAAAEEWYKGRETRRDEFLADLSRWESWFLGGGWDEMRERERESAALLKERRQMRQPPTMPHSMRIAAADVAALSESSTGYASPDQRAPAPRGREIPANAGPPPSSLSPRPPATEDEVRAKRRGEIERRASQLEPPIPPALLADIPSFRDAVRELAPFDDDAWALLKPQLLAQRWMAEHRERDVMAESGTLPKESEGRPQAKLDSPPKTEESRTQERPDTFSNREQSQPQEKSDLFPNFEEKKAQGAKPDLFPQKLESGSGPSDPLVSAEGPVRTRIAEIATDIINDEWDGGKSIRKETCSKFAVDVLYEVATRYFAALSQETGRAGRPKTPAKAPHSLSGHILALADMKWLYQAKISPLTKSSGGIFFLCSKCTEKDKQFTFEGVVSHTASKHTPWLRHPGTVKLNWSAKWPRDHFFMAGLVKKFTPMAASIAPVGEKQRDQQSATTATTPLGSRRGSGAAPPQGRGDGSPQNDVGGVAFPYFHSDIKGHRNFVRIPADDPYRVGIEFMAKWAAGIWKRLSEVQDLQIPSPVSMQVIVYHIVRLYEKHHSEAAALEMFYDAVFNHSSFVPLRVLKGLACKTCKTSPHQAQASEQYDFVGLVSHFYLHHGKRLVDKGQRPEDWRKDMVWLPEGTTAEGFKGHPGGKTGLLIETALPRAAAGQAELLDGQAAETSQEHAQPQPAAEQAQPPETSVVDDSAPQWSEGRRSARPESRLVQERHSPQPESRSVQERHSPRQESRSIQEKHSPRPSGVRHEGADECDDGISDEAPPRLQSVHPARELPSQSPPEYGMQAKPALDADHAERAHRAESVMRTPISRQERHETVRPGSDQDTFEPDPRLVPGRGRRSVSPRAAAAAAHAYGHSYGYRERSPAIPYARHPYDFEGRFDHPRAVPPYTAYEIIEVQDVRGDYIIRRPIRIDDGDMMAYATQSRREMPSSWYSHPHPLPLPHPVPLPSPHHPHAHSVPLPSPHHPHAPPPPPNTPHRYISSYDFGTPMPMPPMERQYSSHGEYYYPPRAKSPEVAHAAPQASQAPRSGSREGSIAHQAGPSSY